VRIYPKRYPSASPISNQSAQPGTHCVFWPVASHIGCIMTTGKRICASGAMLVQGRSSVENTFYIWISYIWTPVPINLHGCRRKKFELQ
jgi:hypothetical protein